MTIAHRRINHVTLAVPAGEHAKVREFYGQVLGLEEVRRPEALGPFSESAITWQST
jgi:catechol 2,3-dioxygenase-like lactoylglutathione lyase family enzyme